MNNTSFFEITPKLNKWLIAAVVVCVFSLTLQIPSLMTWLHSNTVGMMLVKLQVPVIIYWLAYIAELFLWGTLGWEFHKRKNFLQIPVLLFIVFRIISHIAFLCFNQVAIDGNIFGIQMPFTYFSYANYIAGLICTISMIVLAIGLIAKFKGRLRILGCVILLNIILSTLNDTISYWIYDANLFARTAMLITSIVYCLVAAIWAIQLLCVKLSFKTK